MGITKRLLIAIFIWCSSAHCVAGATDDSGIYAIWTNAENYDLDFVKAGQVIVQWKWIQKGHNDYDFTSLDTRLQAMLDQGARVGRNIKTTIQINGNYKPDFLFDEIPYHPSKLKTQVKDEMGTLMYWHPYHIDQYSNLLAALAQHISTSNYKDIIVGIRLNYNRIGTEHSLSSSAMPPLSEWVIPQGMSTSDIPSINGTESRTYKSVIERTYLDNFAPLFTVLVRNSDSYSSQIIDAFYDGSAGVFQTGSEMEPRYRGDEEDRYGPFLAYCRTGIAQFCYAEPWAASDGTHGTATDERWSTYAQHHYWRLLIDLHGGVSAFAVYGEDLARHTNPEYMKSFDFVNKYAGFHAKPGQSPGAWIAFREGAFLKGDYNFLMSRVSDDTNFVGLDLRNDGAWALGDQSVRYSAWARRLSAGHTVTVAMDQEFVSSMSGQNKEVTITYLDRGNGSMDVSAFGRQFSLSVGNSHKWKTTVFSVNGGSDVANITVSAIGSDLTLHMVEVNRLQDVTPASPEIVRINQDLSITPDNSELMFYTIAGDDVTGAKQICLTDAASNEVCTRSINTNVTGGRMSFNSADIVSLLSGDAIVTVTYQDTLYDSDGANQPLTESSTQNVSVEAYSGDQWGSSGGVTITNTGRGVGWAAMINDNEVSIGNNTPIEVIYKFKDVPGDVPVAIQLASKTGGFVEMNGALGAVTLTNASTGYDHVLKQWHVDDIHWVMLTMTTTEATDYEYRVAPSTEAVGDQVCFLRWRLWGDDHELTLTKTHPVEHPGVVSPNPPTLLPIY
jgi:hypothetical protein